MRQFTKPQLFIIAAMAVILLTTGAVWQFPENWEVLLTALVPAWIGIAAVFWILWRKTRGMK